MSGAWFETLTAAGSEDLVAHLLQQGWFRCEPEDVLRAEVVAVQALVDDGPRPLLSVLVEVTHRSGLADLYQLILECRPRDPSQPPGTLFAALERWSVLDALSSPEACARIAAAILGTAPAEQTFEPLGSDVGSSSVRVGALVLKVYRELRPGPNVELEWLECLRDAGFAHVPTLRGALNFTGERIDATLAIVQEYVGAAVPGPEHLRALIGDPDALCAAAAELGVVLARLHGAAAQQPAFAPDRGTPEQSALLVAAWEEAVDAAPRSIGPDDELGVLDAAAFGRDRVRGLTNGTLGALVRSHGDLRLRHALHTRQGWMLIGFQGDLGTATAERRRKRPGLWDVACARRSISRVGEMAGDDAEPWQHAADALADGYRSAIDPSLLPPSPPVAQALQEALELVRAAQLVERARADPVDQRRWAAAFRDLATSLQDPA